MTKKKKTLNPYGKDETLALVTFMAVSNLNITTDKVLRSLVKKHMLDWKKLADVLLYNCCTYDTTEDVIIKERDWWLRECLEPVTFEMWETEKKKALKG